MDYLLEQTIKICLICIIFLPFRLLYSSFFWILMREWDGENTVCDKHSMSNQKLWGQKANGKLG